jgi:sigma-B regulation protein RsbU (phosphoserine phosphatase)
MRKIKNLIIGGIENKVFNLILLTGLLIAAAFIGVLQYQSNMLAKLSAETSAKQQAAITDITTQTKYLRAGA